jgi:hypothetical protein
MSSLIDLLGKNWVSDTPAANNAFGAYLNDAMQRTILFMDVLRLRSDQYFEHKSQPLPNVLTFGAELVLDGRTFDRPVNYILVRILPPDGVRLDSRKRPFVVVDPRAGHGPGIGGFKADSELGMAMREGHTCYFVGFYPEPVPGQTIEDIMDAEAQFLERVNELHPNAAGKPCVIGNCQAGWAVMMLAAVRPELFGPIIVPGSPLSYWAGERGKNPMRYLGGLAGGSWVTAFMSDLGGGKFEGGNLVGNFEMANPANTFWEKNYNLWSNVDTEADRFLEFEKWWNGHVNLNAEEMQWIVDKLFVGNRLATGELMTRKGVRVDLSNIRSPIVCFCSEGDNITPPQQALGWIIDLYERDDDLKAHNQTIVYCIHKNIGHLGIFVSGGVAKKEHSEFASNIDLIDVLPPGLYELVLEPKTEEAAGRDFVHGEWISTFQTRTLADIRAIVKPLAEDERRFATVRRVSEINLGLYRTLLQPLVKALASDQSVDLMNKVKLSELPMLFFSNKNPMMQYLADAAEHVRANRTPASTDHPLVVLQKLFSDRIIASLNAYRDLRDASMEQIFLALYGNPLLQALVGLRATDEGPRHRPGLEPEEIQFIHDRLADLKARIGEGGVEEAVLRSLVYLRLAGSGVDERAFSVLNSMRETIGGGDPLHAFKLKLREQFFAHVLDEKAALAAIPAMLPADATERKKAFDMVRKVIEATGTPEGARADRLKELENLFLVTESAGMEPAA